VDKRLAIEPSPSPGGGLLRLAPGRVKIAYIADPTAANSRKGTTMTEIPANTDRRAKIRARAYAIWEEEGRPEGKHLEHWLQAKRLIAAEELRAAAGPVATHPRDR